MFQLLFLSTATNYQGPLGPIIMNGGGLGAWSLALAPGPAKRGLNTSFLLGFGGMDGRFWKGMRGCGGPIIPPGPGGPIIPGPGGPIIPPGPGGPIMPPGPG